MDDFRDLIVAMLALAVTAVMLVAGALYLIAAPEPTPARTVPSSAVVASSVW
jgi:hypothetical protein